MLSSITTFGEGYLGESDASLSLAMNRSARRGPWLPEEDQALLQLVRTQGANNWVRISQQIQHRSPKQCRERYHQNLKPSLKHDPISAQEGEVIERLVQEMGKRWAEIARRLGNRSDNAVKNWWNGSVNRRRRNPAQTATGFKQVGSRLQPVPFTLRQGQVHSQSALPPSGLGLPTSPSHQSQAEAAKSFGSRALQISGAIHPHNSSTTRASAGLPFDPCAIDSRYSISASTDAFGSRPSLSKVVTSDLRPELPPLRPSSIYFSKSERPFSSVGRPPISPALSDNSQPHAPSLISDTQSMYSISPRTVTTPRPGMSAPTSIANPFWPDNQLTTYQGLPHTACNLPSSPNFSAKCSIDSPLVTTLQRGSVTLGEDRYKDTRMNLSALLQ